MSNIFYEYLIKDGSLGMRMGVQSKHRAVQIQGGKIFSGAIIPR
jgi:hypothetical protein